MALIHLIRHAAPALTGVMLGRLDVDLAPQEIPPSRLRVQAIYASPLRRALETARRLFPDSEPLVLADLAECSLGEWDGLSWPEVERRWPDEAARKARDWCAVTPPSGEPWHRFAARVRAAFGVIRDGPLPAAVVAHAGVNAVLAQCLAGVDPLTLRQKYLEILTYELPDRNPAPRSSHPAQGG